MRFACILHCKKSTICRLHKNIDRMHKWEKRAGQCSHFKWARHAYLRLVNSKKPKEQRSAWMLFLETETRWLLVAVEKSSPQSFTSCFHSLPSQSLSELTPIIRSALGPSMVTTDTYWCSLSSLNSAVTIPAPDLSKLATKPSRMYWLLAWYSLTILAEIGH